MITKASFLGMSGWVAALGLSILVLRKAPEPMARQTMNVLGADAPQPVDGPFDRQLGERARSKNLPPVTEQEWSDAKQFLELHSKHRYELVAKIQEGEKEGLKRFLVNRWKTITELRSKSIELYNTRVSEVELEDAIFGICQELKHSRGDQSILKAELQKKINELFNLGLSERKQRITLVKESLKEQEQAWESDKKNWEKLAKDQYEYVLAHGVEGARLDVGAGHRPGIKSKPGGSATTSPGESSPVSPGTLNQ